MIPAELRYTVEHEWIASTESAAVRIGITHFAQESLGDIVYVQLPEAGAKVTAGDAVGEVESTKSVSDIYAPLSGTVTARNDALGDTPEQINDDPYGAGWLFELEPDDVADVAALLDADAYTKLTQG
ncbi:glycine cleavage system protein GcvH [Phytomonospora endophytica]|uniref:Glycine cleavage system H protein n=1 Tax=Phytomonospora endophytica TaxID=714109 RepID=A0A841FJ48_9ACTN|nr:glycine cleavage system protein GcvH [Phytomonospora endophytica]MBB6035835.1 glycine cleavage system H protein [Phytomonospora endophytica]GIG71514.1 glycine cleavage system H protein [Phytomonospora endophytica]